MAGFGPPLFTERLVLRPVAVADAAAMWPVLGDTALYQWIARTPPGAPADLQARFRRISQPTAPDRQDQWLNWTVWRCDDGAPVGMVETTVLPTNAALIAYLFGRAHWRQGYAGEACAAVITFLETAGVTAFEATIDVRNSASRALAMKLGFQLVETRASADIIAGKPSVEEVWRRTRRD